MGNLLCWRTEVDEVHITNTGDNNTNDQPKKIYSWDNKKRENAQNFIIKDVTNGFRVKFPNEINGEQFIVQNCSKSRIYLLDVIGTLTIDDCENCQFVVGPVKTSVFIRDCKRCEILVACQQFRTRDCSRLTAFLSCATVPVIENTSKFKTAPYQLYYDNLEEQFQSSGLSIYNSNWVDIHDFTPLEEGILNYQYMNDKTLPSDFIDGFGSPLDSTDYVDSAGDGVSSDTVSRINEMHLTDARDDSIVPYTYSSRRKSFMASNDTVFSLVILFKTKPNSSKLGRDLINYVIKKVPETHFTKCNELNLSPQIIEKLFENKSPFIKMAQQDAIIYLEFSGVESLNEAINDFCSQNQVLPTDIYVSSGAEKSKHDIDLISREFKVHMDMS